MKEIIIKRSVKTYTLRDLYLDLGHALFIPIAELKITRKRIDGRQRRFLDDSYLFLYESRNPEIEVSFSAAITRDMFNFMYTIESQIFTLKNKDFEADVFMDSIRVTGEYKDVFTVDVTLSMSGGSIVFTPC